MKNLIQCCGRKNCGALKSPPKLDDVDLQSLWLPAYYLSYMKGSTYLEHTKKDPIFANKREAALEYLKHMHKRIRQQSAPLKETRQTAQGNDHEPPATD